MENTKIFTKGNSSVRGKTKIYLSMHPSDAPLYTNLLTDDILNALDCAVLVSCSELGVEELENILADVNLIVVAVTRRYLTLESFARDTELSVARERGVPVLPIILESGLTDSFNAFFDNVQYLDRTATDATAIGYDKKLASYLLSRCAPQRVVERIKTEFDTGIFLSYRKKDRAHARELMRLIHRQDFCRDVSIWYDEYITPGEDFNKEIESALKKCSVFAMAVTPNLVNENNYVMEHEFPMAKDNEKPIVPAELVSTDKEELERCYRDIPCVVDPTDEDNLRRVLRAALGDNVSDENDHSPEHLYYIGLAYLMGIDVEIDYQRAYELICESVAGGYFPALKKLAFMYYHGEGIERNLKEAIHIQSAVADEYYEAVSGESVTRDDAYGYFFELMLLAEMILSGVPTKEDERIFRILLAAANIVNDVCGSDSLVLARAYKAYADYFYKMGEPHRAKEHYHNAAQSFRYCLPEDNDEEFFGFAECAVSLANCYIHDGDYDAAAEAVGEVITLERSIDTEYVNIAPLANVYSTLALIDHLRGKNRDAIKHNLRAEAIYLANRVKNSPLLYLGELIDCYEQLAESYAKIRKQKLAISYLDKAKQLTEIYRCTDEYRYTYYKASVSITEANASVAFFKLKRAISILNTVEASITAPDAMLAPVDKNGLLYRCYFVYSSVYSLKMRLDLADKYNLKLLEISTERAANNRTTLNYLRLSECYKQLKSASGYYGGKQLRELIDYSHGGLVTFVEGEEEKQIQLDVMRLVKRENIYSSLIFALIFLASSVISFFFLEKLGVFTLLVQCSTFLIATLKALVEWRNYKRREPYYTVGVYDPYAVIDSELKKRSRLTRLSVLLMSATLILALTWFILNRQNPTLFSSPTVTGILSAIILVAFAVGVVMNLVVRDIDIDRHHAFMYVGRVPDYLL